MKVKILVVDDEKNVRRSICGILEDAGYEVFSARSGEECLELLQKTPFDLVFLDVWLPGKNGLEVLAEIKRQTPQQYVLIISGHGLSLIHI